MAHRKNGRRSAPNKQKPAQSAVADKHGLPAAYWKACELVRDNRLAEARAADLRLARNLTSRSDPQLRALIENELAVLDAVEGQLELARDRWRATVESHPDCLSARLNLGLVHAELTRSRGARQFVPSPEQRQTNGVTAGQGEAAEASAAADDLSSALLSSGPGKRSWFNSSFLADPYLKRSACRGTPAFSSTGRRPAAGISHTAGLAEFPSRDGYDVRHIYARFPAWGIGRVTGNGLVAKEAIEFAESEWKLPTIRQRFRAAVDSFVRIMSSFLTPGT